MPGAAGILGASVALFNRETFAYSSALSTVAEANRYQVMVLQYTDAAMAPALKAANPNLKILLYTDVRLSRIDDPAGWSTCTSYTSDQTSHPDWFLRDQNGHLIQDKAYPGDYMMDVGNTAYEQSCSAHATTLAQHAGFDGLYLDDVSANVMWSMPAGLTTPQYPTPAAWQSAMYSMITDTASQAHAKGQMVMGNIGGAYSTPGLWAKWNAQLDGAQEQAWNKPSDGAAQQLREWPAKLAEAAWSEANHKFLLLGSYDTTERGNTFGLGSMLLVAGGWSSYSTSNANMTSDEAWYPEYDIAHRLGTPAGALKRLSNGVYERVFANGIVLVNPTQQATQAFSLGGGRFSGSGLTHASSTTMAPMSALILAVG